MPRVYATVVYMDLSTWPTPLNILSWPRGTSDADGAKGAQKGSLTSHLTNIYVKFDQASEGPLSFTYGLCNSKSRSESHYTIAVTENKGVSRLVWIIPDDSHDNGCISAWTEDNVLVGRKLGLVDEAKQAVEKWMARWIEV
ncbi:hypothetical protein FOBRF1_003151 [Fusarium oxysporum]